MWSNINSQAVSIRKLKVEAQRYLAENKMKLYWQTINKIEYLKKYWRGG